jgi:hypothetical protein
LVPPFILYLFNSVLISIVQDISFLNDPGPRCPVTYELEGQLLAACSCNTPCPCWIGEDPGNGFCKSFLAYHFNRGQVRGIDVAGQTPVKIVYIPGSGLGRLDTVIARRCQNNSFQFALSKPVDRRRGPKRIRLLNRRYNV